MAVISVVVTVLDEVGSVGGLLESLGRGSVVPDEVVVVDAGSTDGTVEELERFVGEGDMEVRVMISEGVNRSVGRNMGIEAARGEIVALTDAGCVVDQIWLERLTSPMLEDPELMVSKGGYRLMTGHPMQRVAARLTDVQPEEENVDYLASSRSMAIRRSVFELGYRYPVELNTAEDLVFAKSLENLKSVVVPDAFVNWEPVEGFGPITKTFFNYALGDGMAGPRSPHWRINWLRVVIYGLALLLITAGGVIGAAMGTLLLLGVWMRRIVLFLVEYEDLNLEETLLAGWIIPWLSLVTTAGFLRGVTLYNRSI